MAQVRGTRFAYLTAAAAAPGNELINGALRDILPDKPFKLHGYSLYLRNKTAELMEMQMMKNIAGPPGPIAGSPTVIAHGLIAESVLYTVSLLNEKVMYVEPIRFDKDDSLNIKFHWEQQAGGMSATFELILLWSEGK